MKLRQYTSGEYTPGAGLPTQIVWYIVSLVIFQSGWFPLSGLKRGVLRLFGATIGRGVVIKPYVAIKFPWRLVVGDYSWIGEHAWIDNLEMVRIGRNSCVSQAVYLCTGSHDHRRQDFALLAKPITLEDETWVGARSVVLPGVTIHFGAVVAAGSTVSKDVGSRRIVGNMGLRDLGSRREEQELKPRAGEEMPS